MYVKQSKGMSYMLALFNFDFQHISLVHLKGFILLNTLSQPNVWLQRYEHFLKFTNPVKHKNLSSLSIPDI